MTVATPRNPECGAPGAALTTIRARGGVPSVAAIATDRTALLRRRPRPKEAALAILP